MRQNHRAENEIIPKRVFQLIMHLNHSLHYDFIILINYGFVSLHYHRIQSASNWKYCYCALDEFNSICMIMSV